MNDTVLEQSQLGKPTGYATQYDPKLLFAIPRAEARTHLGLASPLPFQGVDVWNAYEISWLDAQGLPHAAVGEFRFPCESVYLVESKSLKLYLSSFTQTTFNHIADVSEAIEQDLSQLTGAPTPVRLTPLGDLTHGVLQAPLGECLDNLAVACHDYQPNPSILSNANDERVTESLYSHVLKSNCPVTGQPDFATAIIQYTGAKIDRANLLRYIVSFRNHSEFHEACAERMFRDISEHCQTQQLAVYLRYTRRGGLDINPYRATEMASPVENLRLWRQ